MKWINHNIVTFSTVYMYTNDLCAASMSLLGAVFPDFAEGKPPQGSSAQYWRWRKQHRGFSHWLFFYVALLLLLLWARQHYSYFFAHPMGATFCLYFLIGCILHILEDAICGKVPFFSLKKKYGIKCFEVGGVLEYLFVIAFVVLCVLVKLKFV